MLARYASRLVTSASKHRAPRKVLTAVIGCNPEVEEGIRRLQLVKNIIPIYLRSKEDLKRASDYEAALVVQTNPDEMETFLKANPGIKWIHSTMAGVDRIMNPTLTNSSIAFTNAKGAFSDSLAEFVLYGMLHFAKKAPYFAEQRKKKQWTPIEVDNVHGKRVGIIGYGNIGATTARLLKKSMDMTIRACCDDPEKLSAAQKRPCEYICSADKYAAVIQDADYVVGILPKAPTTDNYFNMAKFKLMHPSTVFINIGRGTTMCEVHKSRDL
jgi:phosphoglycerate dehydrogenase-like enzyme